MLGMLVKYIFKKIGPLVPDHSFELTFFDGTTYRNSDAPPLFTIIFRSKRSYWYVLLFQGYGMAEAYIKGYLDIDGSVRQLALMQGKIDVNPKTPLIFKSPFLKPFDLNRIRNQWHELRFSNRSVAQAKRNAKFHYDRGTEMFRQYLDPSMTYTCAYWKEGTMDLAQAQKDKMDHTLKKLRLKAGETLVDVGGGWGELLFRAHELYGVVGTNVSPTPDQNEAMRAEIQQRGLNGKIKIKEMDFREDTEVYDKYISLGVYEHAGYGQLESWIKGMSDNLKEGGVGVLHFIGNIKRDLELTGIFIRKFVFPGGYLPGLAETLEMMDRYDLEILDIENLRRHYIKTLDAWAHNFDAHWEVIRALDPKKYDERFRRQWRFFLHSCSATFDFESLNLGVYQITFSKGKAREYPMTRDFLYEKNLRSSD
ncbi:MAG: cyclopropane-fatty-acyl-phospholipid synthase family protein [bacterium]|nr:cyclopropane-fatty-acyl-phospholipid synthase family protein [bacterium]